jgi:hypothetical protein
MIQFCFGIFIDHCSLLYLGSRNFFENHKYQYNCFIFVVLMILVPGVPLVLTHLFKSGLEEDLQQKIKAENNNNSNKESEKPLNAYGWSWQTEQEQIRIQNNSFGKMLEKPEAGTITFILISDHILDHRSKIDLRSYQDHIAVQ